MATTFSDLRWTTPVGEQLDTRRLGLIARAGVRRPSQPSRRSDDQPVTWATPQRSSMTNRAWDSRYDPSNPLAGPVPLGGSLVPRQAGASPWWAWGSQMRPPDNDWPPDNGSQSSPPPPEQLVEVPGLPWRRDVVPPRPTTPGDWYFDWKQWNWVDRKAKPDGDGDGDGYLPPIWEGSFDGPFPEWTGVDVPLFEYKDFSYDPFTGQLTLPEKFSYPEFERPGWEQVLEDPGYQFRLQEGQKALEQSASARGTLRTGGTWKDILNWGQGLASQEYGNVYGRRLGEHQMGFGEALTEYDRDVASALARYNAELGAYGTNWATAAGVWDRNFGAARTAYDFDWRRAMQEAAWANQFGLAGYNAAWDAYLNDQDMWWQNVRYRDPRAWDPDWPGYVPT